MERTTTTLLLVAVGVLSMSVSSGAVGLVWDSGSWDHSSFNGSNAAYNGWNDRGDWVDAGSPPTGSFGDSTSLVTGGVVTLTDSTSGISTTVTISVSSDGTADADHGAFDRNLTVPTDGNYLPTDIETTFNGGASGDPATLVVPSVNDSNSDTGNVANYVKVTFSFTNPVIFDSFELGDIDSSSSSNWNDNVAVDFSNNSTFINSTPVSGGSGNKQEDRSVISGDVPFQNDKFIRGVSSVNNDSTGGEADFGAPNQEVDEVELYFWSNTGNSEHAIFILPNAISFAVVPEPSTYAAGGLFFALMAGVSLARRRKAKAGKATV